MRAKPQQKIVKRSDSDCRFEETCVEGAAGSSATVTAPGAPGGFMSVGYWGSAALGVDMLLERRCRSAVGGRRVSPWERWREVVRGGCYCVLVKGLSLVEYRDFGNHDVQYQLK